MFDYYLKQTKKFIARKFPFYLKIFFNLRVVLLTLAILVFLFKNFADTELSLHPGMYPYIKGSRVRTKFLTFLELERPRLWVLTQGKFSVLDISTQRCI